MSYTVVARGREVIKRLERVLPHAAPIQGNATAVGGRVDLQPGTLVMPQRMLVVGKIGFEAVWLDFPKAELRSVPEQQFLNGFFLGQVVSEVDRRTAWLTPVSRATMAFTMGVMSGALGWFAVAGAAGAGALSASVAIYRNQHKLAMVTKHLGEVLTIHSVKIVQQPGQRAYVRLPENEQNGRYFPVVSADDQRFQDAVQEKVLTAWQTVQP